MKRISLVLLVLVGVVMLSGCTLLPSPAKKNSITATPLTKKGSIWKSVDGGATFEPKIMLETSVPAADEKKKAVAPQEITNADILTISFNPNDANVLYIGTKNDGIFKTENGGETWKTIKFPPQKIYSFTMDRNNPDKQMFAAGVLYEVGKIFRTDDGGGNWKEVYSEPGTGTYVTAMSQHRVDTNVIFAGTSGGTVIKSTDGGQTWRNIGQKIDGPVTEIIFDATKNFSVYVLSYKKRVYYSSNGGEDWINWEEKKKEEVKALEEAGKSREVIDAVKKKNLEEKMPIEIVSLATSSSISGMVYAGTQKGQLYRSMDHGKNWKQINIIESAGQFPIRMIAASFDNKNEISFISRTAFYKSINNGESWAVTQLNVDRPVSIISYNPKDSNIIYLGLSNDSQ